MFVFFQSRPLEINHMNVTCKIYTLHFSHLMDINAHVFSPVIFSTWFFLFSCPWQTHTLHSLSHLIKYSSCFTCFYLDSFVQFQGRGQILISTINYYGILGNNEVNHEISNKYRVVRNNVQEKNTMVVGFRGAGRT